MRVAVFGGSFNPPHLAHQMAALGALETAADAVWMIPTFRHAFGKDLAPFADRVEMCRRIAAALGDRVVVSRLEQELGGESRTLHTLERLRELLPDASFRLLVGADILAETASWYRWDEVAQMAPPLVLGRAGVPAPVACDLILPDISSTEIRRRLAGGEEVRGLLPESVLGYIVERGLYR